jgi:hypothetical protein
MTAEEGSKALCVCVPDTLTPQPEWEETASGEILFQIYQPPDVRLLLSFAPGSSPREAEAGALFLDHRHQQAGIASRFARNAYIVMRRIGVERVFVQANFAGGGYSWAKLGAVPTNMGEVTQYLLDQVDALHASQRIRTHVYREFRQLVMFNSDPYRLLLRVAASKSPSNPTNELQTVAGVPLGREILAPSSWHGIWDFTDAAHVDAIEDALGL